MKLVRIKPYILHGDVIANSYVVINRTVEAELKKVRKEGTLPDLAGTILDEEVHKKGGAIPLPEAFDLINIAYARKVTEKRWLTIHQKNIANVIRELSTKPIFRVPANAYLFVPPGLSRVFITDSGLDVMDPIQRRFDNMVGYYHLWLAGYRKYDANLEYQWLRAYNRLLEAAADRLLRRKGWYDRGIGCLWPYSLRATIVPNPNLQLNEVELPMKVLIRWMAKKEFRDAWGVPDDISIRDAVRMLDGKRVLCGRQPSHDSSNLLSFKIRIPK